MVPTEDPAMPDLPTDVSDASPADDPALQLPHALDDYASLHGEDAAGLGL